VTSALLLRPATDLIKLAQFDKLPCASTRIPRAHARVTVSLAAYRRQLWSSFNRSTISSTSESASNGV
jgi:hypothetical protein